MTVIENVNYTIKKIVTNIQDKPNEAQLVLKNTRNKDVTIFSISLLVDRKFTTEGNLVINVYGTTNDTLADIRAGDLEDVATVVIDLGSNGFNFRKNDELRFFVWRAGAGSNIKLNVDITTGEKINSENQLIEQFNFRGSGIQRGNRR